MTNIEKDFFGFVLIHQSERNSISHWKKGFWQLSSKNNDQASLWEWQMNFSTFLICSDLIWNHLLNPSWKI